ncbi:DUF5806 family protein [Haloparvum sp. PAK95]|uniref:DUF5806 family protein n=1 Tax=Haloparvum sp. PAK95 TaxID=3418962 RepID=UPI003D2F31D1
MTEERAAARDSTDEGTETGTDPSAASDDPGEEPAADESPIDDAAGNDAAGDDAVDEAPTDEAPDQSAESDVPRDVRKYERFQKMDGAQYDRVNEFLRDRTYVTAREWAIARLCADFRTETGVEMTKIGENLPELIPFMTDTYSPQAVNQARHSFEEKVTKAGATFLYGAMCGFFTAEDLDETMYEVTEIAKFLLEVEGVDLDVEDELEAEERISSVMREVRESSQELRGEEVQCPECGHVHEPVED